MRASILGLVLFVACGETRSPPSPQATPRGTSLGAVATAAIGPPGGTLTSGDGRVQLAVPPGALASAATIGIEPIFNFAHGGLGSAYRFTPDGMQFAAPVTLRFAAAAYASTTSLEGIGVAFQDAGGFWQRLPTTVDGDTVVATTSHFTDESLVAGALLSPLTAAVKEGQSLELQVVWCYENTSGDLMMGYTCSNELAPLYPGAEWSVNGQVGGNARVGTVQSKGLTATYVAPAKAPSPRTVDVTVRFTNGIILFSHVTIGQAKDLIGTFSIDWAMPVDPGMVQVTANATLTLADEGPDEANYEMSGTAEISPRSFLLAGEYPCSVDDPYKAIENQSYFKVRREPVSAVRWSYFDSWAYTCVGPNGNFPTAVFITFWTMTGSYCKDFADVPITDENAPSGKFTMTCQTGFTGVAEWSFKPN